MSETWEEELDFWFERASHDFKSFEDAIKRGDAAAAACAKKQHALCTRRYYAVEVPDDVLARRAKKVKQ